MVKYIRYPLFSPELHRQTEITCDVGQVWDQTVQVVSQQEHRNLRNIRSKIYHYIIEWFGYFQILNGSLFRVFQFLMHIAFPPAFHSSLAGAPD